MEKKAFLHNFVVILLLHGWLLTANVVAAELKIGYVNFIKVIEKAPQGEAAKRKLEAEFGPRDKKLVATQNDIRAMEQDIEKNALIMTDADRRSKEREIVLFKRDLRRATQEFREDYNLRRNEELAALQKIVQRVIVEIAKQENYDLILHEGTIYASSTVDITDQVLENLSQQTKNQ